jgi:hypothetical protein
MEAALLMMRATALQRPLPASFFMAQQPHGNQPMTLLIGCFNEGSQTNSNSHGTRQEAANDAPLTEPRERKPLDELRGKLSACQAGGTEQSRAKQK